jgi:membrane protein YqaA with SNARE-associated domain
MLASIQTWAASLGGVGLLVIALLDSSFLSFPQVNDLLIIVLSTKYPERMPYYAGMTMVGSIVGCFLLYGVARKGGEVFLRRRFSAKNVDRAMVLYQRFGLLAVVVPALLPPPTPFKIFVLLAGAAAVSPWRFAAAIAIGRGIRYFGEGYLAVMYGDRAADLVEAHGAEVGIGLAVLAVAIGVAFYLLRRQRVQPSLDGSSEGSKGR